VLAYDVKHVDVVELSRDVIEASRLFGSINARYWEDPRVNVVWEDAKTYLQVSDRKYDVIISEPTNPWIVGVAGVFSKEYFEICRDHLRTGGMFVQWIQGYELEDSTFFMMLETFSGVFPYYTIWNPTSSDTVLVGACAPYGNDLGNMKSLAARPSVLEDLKLIGIESLLPILGMQMRDSAGRYSHVAWTGAIHSDFFPLLEYAAARGFYVGSLAEGVKRLDCRNQSPVNAGIWLKRYLEENAVSASELRNCYTLSLSDRGLNSKQALCWAGLWLRIYPGDPDARVAMAEQISVNHDTILGRIGKPSVGNKSYIYQKLWCRFAFEDYMVRRTCLDDAGAAELVDDFILVACSPDGCRDADVLKLCGEILYDLGRYAEACGYLESAARILSGMPGRRDEFDGVSTILFRALLANGEAARAHALCGELFSGEKISLKRTLIRAEISAAVELSRGN